MARIPRKAPPFDLNLLTQFLSTESQSAEDIGPTDPDRRALLKQGAAAIGASLLPAPGVEALANAGELSSYELESLAQDYRNLFIEINLHVAALDSEQIGLALLVFPENGPVNPQDAIAWTQRYIEAENSAYEGGARFHRFLLEHPEHTNALKEAIKRDPVYNARVHWEDDEFELDEYQSVEKMVSDVANLKRNAFLRGNMVLYKRCGVMLPGTSAEDANYVRQMIEKQRSKMFDELHSPLIARRYAEDVSIEGHHQPTYLLNLDNDPRGTPADTSYAFHRLIAQVVKLYPSDLHTSDDMRVADRALSGRLLLTPTRMGLLVTFPAEYETTPLSQFKDQMDTLVAQTKFQPMRAEREL